MSPSAVLNFIILLDLQFFERQKKFTGSGSNVKAISAQFEGFGNALRLFDRRNRLQFSTKSPKELFSEANRQLASFGDSEDFAEGMSVAAREAQVELDGTIGNFFKKVESGEDLTDVAAWKKTNIQLYD